MSATTEASQTATITGLRFLWLEITEKCNLTCTHCYADSGPTGSVYGAMHREDWLRLIVEAAEFGCEDLQFIGGEPTMHPDLRWLISEARRAGFMSIEVFTNATRLGGDLIRCFQEYDVRVASSFYTADPATHARITGSMESWQRTVDGLRAVLVGGISLRIGVIEMEQNAGHLGRTTAFLNSLGIQKVRADRQRGVGRGGLHLFGEPTGEFDQLCGQCWNGRLCVTHSGTVYPCVFARAFSLGDARGGLAPILSSVGLSQFRTRLQKSHRPERSAHSCDPYSCNPDDQCSPDCTPNYGCAPEEPGCNPDANSDCTPAE